MAGGAVSFLLIWRRNACWRRINYLQALKAEEGEVIADFAGHYEVLLSELTEEDREQPFVSEDAFVPAEVKKGSLKAGMLDASTGNQPTECVQKLKPMSIRTIFLVLSSINFFLTKEIQFLKNNDWTDEYLVDLNERRY